MTTVPVDFGVFNDNFNSRGTNAPAVARRVQIALGQEGKAEQYAHLLDPDDYGVLQDTSSAAKAGSFIIWRRADHLGPGRETLVFAADGGDILARYLAGKAFKAKAAVRPGLYADLLALSGHRPPERDDELWAEWDDNFADRVHRRPAHRHVVAGCDWNEHTPAVVKRAGLVWHSVGNRRIDGFASCPCIRFTDLRILPKWTSDHEPVIGRAHVPTRPCSH